ncbi:MAG TPA: maleylpyruvate isomerase family mycothiol-dependent enzyme [Thermoanaerobaculia bacterium]|nr:maleylpyruvate isomerase family mycothiol-dependent enzyme [Thermoanaerobaculia bacterium]
MREVGRIDVAELFPELDAELIPLLRGLSEEDWSRPAVGSWTVKDVAAHLLDTAIRRLSFGRDRLPLVPPDRPIQGYEDFVAFLNDLNAVWVRAMKRVSPRILTNLLEKTGAELSEHLAGLDPSGPALFSVAWAGEEASESWFDVAREYTERWHHQQQIRDAVGAPGITGRRLMYPVLDAFLRALPHTYRAVEAGDGTAIAVEITGEAGGEWALVREGGRWQLYEGAPDDPRTRVRMDQDTAWRRMTKGITKEQAAERSEVTGARSLGEPVFGMLSIMA